MPDILTRKHRTLDHHPGPWEARFDPVCRDWHVIALPANENEPLVADSIPTEKIARAIAALRS